MEQEQEVVDIQEEKKKKVINTEDLVAYNQKVKQKGVCYLSQISSCLNVQRIRELLSSYSVERVYLEPFENSQSTNRKKNRRYKEGWVEFSDKNMAKMVALSLNGQKIFNSKRGMNADELWSIKYLSKFQWEDLAQQQIEDNRVRKDKLMLELNKAKRQKEFFMENMDKSKVIKAIQHRKHKSNNSHLHQQSKPITKHMIKEFKQRKPLD